MPIDHVENHKIQQNQNESDESKCGIKENSFSVPHKRICEQGHIFLKNPLKNITFYLVKAGF